MIVGYFEDGGNLVTMAMNGWGQGEPAWWLNFQANPDARVDLVEGPRRVRAHAASGDERVRLWDRWRQIDDNLDAYAACVRLRRLWSCWSHGQTRRDRRKAGLEGNSD